MQISERRQKILEFLNEKKQLSYEDILEAFKQCENLIEILNDLDILTHFKFLQHTEHQKKSELELTAQLTLRKDLQKIIPQLKGMEGESSSWYRKLAILTVLSQEMELNQIYEAVYTQYPHVGWSLTLVESSLRILADSEYVCTEKGEKPMYFLTSNGISLLKERPFQQFVTLGELKDEFTTEFRTYEILGLVRNNPGIPTGEITRHLQKKYGKKGNKKRAISNTLENMVFSGLLKRSGGIGGVGNRYYLGKTAESLINLPVIPMENHTIQDFKKTVEQFFREYDIGIGRADKTSIERILDDLEQCRLNLSLRSPEEWATRIVFITNCLRNMTPDTWERKAFQCICACILSQLLPSEVSINILEDYPLLSTPSAEQHHMHIKITSEYYFNLTKSYLDLGQHEKASQLFERLELLSSESFDFFILKGRMCMLKCDVRKTQDMREILDAFKNALRMSKGKERVIALFYMGLAQYQRGNLKELKPETPEEERRLKELEKRSKPTTPDEQWENKGAKEIWEACLDMGCTVNQEITVRHNLANAYRMLGELKKAKENYELIITLTGSSPEREKFKYQSLIGLANVLIDLCEWDEAEENLRKTIKEYAGDLPVVSIAKTNFGVLLDRKGKFDEALLCHNEALELIDTGNPNEYGVILINSGDTLRQLGRADEAMNKFREAESIMGNGDMSLVLALKISEADLFFDMGDLDKSWDLSHSVLQERWLGTHRLIAEAYRIQGKILFRKNEFHTAREKLEKSENILKELNLKYELLEVYRLLEECYRNLKDGEQEINYKNKRETLAKENGLPLI